MALDKYQVWSKDEKNLKREYSRNQYKNVSDENKQSKRKNT